MKLSNFFFAISLVLLLCSACQKESYYNYGKVIEGQFIKANINGKEKEMVATNGDIFYNAYYISEDPAGSLDQLNLIRYSKDGTEGLQIFIQGWRLLEQNFPLQLSPENGLCNNCLPAELQFIRLSNNEFKQEIVFLDMVIDEWDDEGYMTGTFSGTAGSSLSVTNGTFRIRIFQTEG